MFTIGFEREYAYDDYLKGWRVEGEEPRLLPLDEWPAWVTYVTYQLEVGAENGLEHFQGYLELRGKQTIIRMKKELPGMERAHFDVRRGTQDQAMAYAQKEDTRVDGPWTHGEPKAQGKRNDLQEVKDEIDRGVPMVDIWDNHIGTMVRYGRGFKEYKRIKTPKRDWLPQVYIILGPTRSGKSRLARAMAPDAYWKAPGKWWDDYDGHSDVVWDEFRANSCSFTDLLRVLDSTPLAVETKGSSVQYVARMIIFTTNIHPMYWYDPVAVHHTWADSPLRARIEEFGCIIQTGAVQQGPNPERFPGVYNDGSDMMMELARESELASDPAAHVEHSKRARDTGIEEAIDFDDSHLRPPVPDPPLPINEGSLKKRKQSKKPFS